MVQKNIYFVIAFFVFGISLVTPHILRNVTSVNAQSNESRKADGITVSFFNNVTATGTDALISSAVDVAGFDSVHFHSMRIGTSNNTVVIQRSVDNVVWFDGQTFNIPGGFANYDIESKYYRLKINNPTPGTTYYSKAYLKTTH